MQIQKSIFFVWILSFFIVLPCLLQAQTPNKMSYQAIIYDTNNTLISNSSVGMRISILKDSINGTAEYVETHTVTTNANGLVDIEIGGGVVTTGSFGAIDWASTSHYIKTETDPAGGTSYSITGSSQLLSVPYAQYANSSGDGLPSGGSSGQILQRTGSTSSSWTDKTKTEDVKFYICVNGTFPSFNNLSSGNSSTYIGQIIFTAWSFGSVSGDFLECNGQLLPINNYQALFSLLGTSYGGNGQTTFALPNLNNAGAVPKGQ